ncbi:MAG: hypothetical protein WC374_07520 [Phycisphaerae bacterium]|jgi:hypothetical protein
MSVNEILAMPYRRFTAFLIYKARALERESKEAKEWQAKSKKY